jgi:hypothetical protein
MSQPLTTTTTQAELDRHIRLVEAVRGLSVCRVYHAWKTMGVAGLEAEIRRRDAEKEQNANTSQKNY